MAIEIIDGVIQIAETPQGSFPVKIGDTMGLNPSSLYWQAPGYKFPYAWANVIDFVKVLRFPNGSIELWSEIPLLAPQWKPVTKNTETKMQEISFTWKDPLGIDHNENVTALSSDFVTEIVNKLWAANGPFNGANSPTGPLITALPHPSRIRTIVNAKNIDAVFPLNNARALQYLNALNGLPGGIGTATFRFWPVRAMKNNSDYSFIGADPLSLTDFDLGTAGFYSVNLTPQQLMNWEVSRGNNSTKIENLIPGKLIDVGAVPDQIIESTPAIISGPIPPAPVTPAPLIPETVSQVLAKTKAIKTLVGSNEVTAKTSEAETIVPAIETIVPESMIDASLSEPTLTPLPEGPPPVNVPPETGQPNEIIGDEGFQKMTDGNEVGPIPLSLGTETAGEDIYTLTEGFDEWISTRGANPADVGITQITDVVGTLGTGQNNSLVEPILREQAELTVLPLPDGFIPDRPGTIKQQIYYPFGHPLWGKHFAHLKPATITPIENCYVGKLCFGQQFSKLVDMPWFNKK